MRTVNPERTRRYLNRTLNRPQESWTVTKAEAQDVADYEYAWERGDQDRPIPPVLEWRAQVQRWAKARGVRVRWLADARPIGERLPDDRWPQVLSWEVRER